VAPGREACPVETDFLRVVEKPEAGNGGAAPTAQIDQRPTAGKAGYRYIARRSRPRGRLGASHAYRDCARRAKLLPDPALPEVTTFLCIATRTATAVQQTCGAAPRTQCITGKASAAGCLSSGAGREPAAPWTRMSENAASFTSSGDVRS
jgi:hypothetical protein